MYLFKIKDLEFKEEEFLDDLSEFEDLIPIIQDLSDELSYEKIECVGENDCCSKTNENYIVEILGFLNEDDEFITKEEVEKNSKAYEGSQLDIFVIRLYKCTSCGKWIVDILE